MKLNSDSLIDAINERNALLDGKLLRVSLADNNGVMIAELRVASRTSSEVETIVIRFSDVRRFDFYYDDSNYCYLIERYKAFRLEEGFYMSLDPYDETNEVHCEDRGIVLSTEIEGELLLRS